MVIALLTDFGTQDYFVGAMKGVILSIAPDVPIVDITHEIPPQDIRAAAFTLAACYRDFPKGTIFVAVVDPGVGSDRRSICVDAAGYRFLGPDNGSLTFVLDDETRVFHLTNEKFFLRPVNQTFHGRDVFAPVAAHLAKGIALAEFGPEIDDPVRFDSTPPRKISDSEIEGQILHIDRFGNLISNLGRADLSGGFTLEINGQEISDHRKFYSERPAGELFSIFGSAGYLEISSFRASAAERLRARVGDKITVTIISKGN